ncbi:MAG: glutamine-hydrolyzing carbamoyl-phosphate synthase small subunit [Oscillospiraceae bacterium]|nr:glutamine-hydrolyzing carbamoyl-phosphate synthase small subunit [Oscillospiraceae bacterium]
MSIYNAQKAWLMLADGTVYEGSSFGAAGTAIGEVVCTTAVTGCQEILTDPSYCGQITVQTFPLIGNYGTNDDDAESDDIFMKGYIVREWCDSPSNFRAKERIDNYLKEHNTIGLFDIDTRALTRKLRVNGVMNGLITTEPITEENREKLLAAVKAYHVAGVVDSVTVKKNKLYPAHGTRKHRVAMMDFGYKRNLRENLRALGCDVIVVPARITAAELAQLKVDGIVLSNGPGDPAENVEVIGNVKDIMALGTPIMGVCLGHQLLALANGFKTEKMGFGHRGGNQPVIDLASDRTYVTSQNHGYDVVIDSIDASVAKISHVNANDKSCEGLEYIGVPAFSVQFHPAITDCPVDTSYIYDKFIKMMDKSKEGK